MRRTSSTRVEAVDAADELDVVRAPGRIGPHRLHVFGSMRQVRRRIVPGQRQVHDARRHSMSSTFRQLARRMRRARRAALRACRRAVVEVNLQRAHARRDVDDARQCCARAACSSSACTRKRSSRSSTARPYSISRYVVAIGAVDHRGGRFAAGSRGRARIAGFELARDAAVAGSGPPSAAHHAARSVGLERLRPAPASRGAKRTVIAGLELAELPELGLDHHRGANESARGSVHRGRG